LDLLFIRNLFIFKFLSEIVDFFLFLVKNFKLLSIFITLGLSVSRKIIFNITNRFSVGLNNFAAICNLFFLHFDFSVILFNAVH